ncbi:hypothetical protein ACVWWK_006738 [Bradyrhizobium sp. LB9.1b]
MCALDDVWATVAPSARNPVERPVAWAYWLLSFSAAMTTSPLGSVIPVPPYALTVAFSEAMAKLPCAPISEPPPPASAQA